MFHWICPECGREIAPAVRECPVCDPQAAAAIAVEPDPVSGSLAVIEPPLFAALEIAPPPAAAPVEPAAPPPLETDPLVALALKLREEHQEAVAQAEAQAALDAEPDPDPIPEFEPALAGRAAVDAPPPRSVAAGPAIPAPEPVSAPVALRSPAAPAPVAPQPPAPATEALSLPRSEPQELVAPPPAAPEPIPQPPPDSRVPGNGAWARLALPLAALQDYSAPALRSIRPQNSRSTILRPDSGPRITLPGPALPAQLNSLEAAGMSRILTERPRKAASQSSYGWLVSMVVMLGLLMVGITVLFAFLPRAAAPAAAPHEVQAADTVPAPVVTPASAPASTAPASYPLAKSVEVTGFRFEIDAAKRPEIHYLVVNHSASPLNDLTVFVTLQTANPRPGQPPLCRFSFRPAALGPYEAKEMVSAIQKLPSGVPLPEWQDLKAEVELAQ